MPTSVATDSPGLHRLQPADTGPFEQVYAIYVDVFPASERKSHAELEDMLAQSDYHFLVDNVEGVVNKFAILKEIRKTKVVLLEYMAVRRINQSRGLGSIMFKRILERRDFAEAYILMEIEDERAGDPQGVLYRRKKFYRSLGCCELAGLDYVMPSVGDKAPPPMNLYVHAPNSLDFVPRTVVIEWLTGIYAKVYSKSSTDYRLLKMIDQLPEKIKALCEQ